MNEKADIRPGHDISDATLDEICGSLREGRTLSEICRRRAMPSRTEVMRWCEVSPETEQRLLEARQTGIWSLLDDALDRLSKAEGADFAKAKEFAGHVRWLAGKLMREQPAERKHSEPRRVEVHWLDALPEEERQKYRDSRGYGGR